MYCASGSSASCSSRRWRQPRARRATQGSPGTGGLASRRRDGRCDEPWPRARPRRGGHRRASELLPRRRAPLGRADPADLRGRPARMPEVRRHDADDRADPGAEGDRQDPEAPADQGPRRPRRIVGHGAVTAGGRRRRRGGVTAAQSGRKAAAHSKRKEADRRSRPPLDRPAALALAWWARRRRSARRQGLTEAPWCGSGRRPRRRRGRAAGPPGRSRCARDGAGGGAAGG